MSLSFHTLIIDAIRSKGKRVEGEIEADVYEGQQEFSWRVCKS